MVKKRIRKDVLEISYKKRILPVEYFLRRGTRTVLMYLHGMGSSKMDFANALKYRELDDYALAGFDFPGSGGSFYPEKTSFNMDDLAEMTHIVLEKLGLEKPIIIGHSMGGLVALLFARKYEHEVSGFINVEGNLTPEDCFASRTISRQNLTQFKRKGFPLLIHELINSNDKSFRRYGKELKLHASAKALHDYAKSLVSYSDSGKLIKWFAGLAMPLLFVYGSDNRNLSSIPLLRKHGIPLAEIPASGHAPFFDNPKEYYHVIAQFAAGI